MQFSVTVNGQCASGGHVHLTVTAGQQSRDITVTREDLLLDFSDMEDVKDALLTLLRSRIKESGATTVAQRRTAIESAPFYL